MRDAPWWLLRAVIRGGSRLVERPARPLLPLDADRLVAAACRRAGVREPADTSFLDPLRRFLRAVEDEARITLLGRIAVREDVTRLLANRFRVERDRARDPGIAQEAIDQPIFITGVPRSGSTLLHCLLAQDPANRVPQTWEMMNPSPPPRRETYDHDPRIRIAERDLRWFQRLNPEFRRIHDVGARLPEECVIILAHSMVSSQFTSMYAVPSYSDWVGEQDLTPAYRLHRRFLQHLQRHCRGERWVLKAPVHLPGLAALFAVYADARVVMTHREPVEVLGSEASLLATLRSTFSDVVDPVAIGRETTELMADDIRRGLEARDRGAAAPDRFHDVAYGDMLGDPIGVVRRIYARFDLRLTPQVEARMRRFLAERPKDRFGAHEYALREFGLDPDRERERYRAYRERFLAADPRAA